jgi:putative membrane protein
MWECFSKWFRYPQRLAFLLPVILTLSVSAIYEVIEWLVADIFFVEEDISYLGTQGDVWDAQKDMGIAFIGACIAALLFYLFSLSKQKVSKGNV